MASRRGFRNKGFRWVFRKPFSESSAQNFRKQMGHLRMPVFSETHPCEAHWLVVRLHVVGGMRWFDGFLLIGCWIHRWLINSTIRRRIFASGAGGRGSPLGPGGPAPLAKIIRRIVEFVNQRWIQQPMGRNPSNHRILPTTCKRTTSQCASQGCVSEKSWHPQMTHLSCFRKFWAHLAFRKRLPKHPSETHVSEATPWGH